jgi:hypothetical protein
MRLDNYSLTESTGIWDPANGIIIIKRDQLKNIESYAGVLLHEVAHVKSGAADVCIQFENQLTNFLGITSTKNLKGWWT